jgi:hypothetical protein
MPKEAFDHDEIYEEARKACNKENVDYSLNRLHALAFEAEYDLSLTAMYAFVEEEPIDNLFTSAQHVQLRQVFPMGELQAIKNKYSILLHRYQEQLTQLNDLRYEANRRAGFITKVVTDLRQLQQLAANTEIVVERLEYEIESLELAIAFDQERMCF